MLGMLHSLILMALGGVRLRDAVEAAAFERQRPAIPRHEALGPAARIICLRVDAIEADVRASMAQRRV